MGGESFGDWFDRFVEEKEIPYASWEIEAGGQTHFIDNRVVIEQIREGASPEEQQTIKDVLVKIDFENGDVNHFFRHLAEGLAKSYASQ